MNSEESKVKGGREAISVPKGSGGKEREVGGYLGEVPRGGSAVGVVLELQPRIAQVLYEHGGK